MCRRVTCRSCGKATWAGCGNHIEQALAAVPAADRCTCTKQAKEAKPTGSGTRRTFFSRVRGR